jgi:5'-nucleotidase
MRILLTNDDGYDQPGLIELENLLKHDHEIWVVAPLHHCSGTSHALGLYSSMELREESFRKWSLEGTPTDCVKVALMEVMKDNPLTISSTPEPLQQQQRPRYGILLRSP